MSYTTPETDTLFLTNLTTSGIAGYETLEKPPLTAGSEIELSQAVSSTSGEVLLKAFASPALGLESIPVGDYVFSIYGAVSAMDGVSELVGRVYQRTYAGTETQLFNFTTGEVEATTDTPTLYTVTYSSTSVIDTAITDRLILKMYAKSDYATDITVSLFYLGTTHQSRMQLPVSVAKITGGDMLAFLYDPDYDGIPVSAATNPLTALGGLIYGGDSDGTQTQLAMGTTGYYLKASTDGIPEWAASGGGAASSDLAEHTHTGSTDGGLIRLDTITAPTDSTSLDASSDMHGLFPKLSGSVDDYMNGTGSWTIPAGSLTPQNVLLATDYDATEQAITTTDINAWTELTNINPSITTPSSDYDLLCMLTISQKSDSANWEWFYIRFVDTTTSSTDVSESWRESVEVNAVTTRFWERTYHTVFENVIAGTHTITAQWLTPSDLDVKIYSRRLTIQAIPPP